jgi:hypothetical protein
MRGEGKCPFIQAKCMKEECESGDRENEGWREEVVYDPRTLRTEKWRERQIGPGSSFLVQRTASSQYANQCSGILVHLFCSAEQGLGY